MLRVIFGYKLEDKTTTSELRNSIKCSMSSTMVHQMSFKLSGCVKDNQHYLRRDDVKMYVCTSPCEMQSGRQKRTDS